MPLTRTRSLMALLSNYEPPAEYIGSRLPPRVPNRLTLFWERTRIYKSAAETIVDGGRLSGSLIQ